MTDVTSKSVVKLKDLDCYLEPPVEYEGIVENRIPLVEPYINDCFGRFRLSIRKAQDVVDEVYNLNDRMFHKAHTTVNGIASSVVGIAEMTRAYTPKATAIFLGSLAGLMMGFQRGGVASMLKHTFGAGALMTTFCYPEEACQLFRSCAATGRRQLGHLKAVTIDAIRPQSVPLSDESAANDMDMYTTRSARIQ
uniref:MICOS complex subunit n=1 Tax=Trichuris muris TaxID=70415 RepID=A0A5S6Q6G5_TRIMR